MSDKCKIPSLPHNYTPACATICISVKSCSEKFNEHFTRKMKMHQYSYNKVRTIEYKWEGLIPPKIEEAIFSRPKWSYPLDFNCVSIYLNDM